MRVQMLSPDKEMLSPKKGLIAMIRKGSNHQSGKLEKEIVAKALDGQRCPLPLSERLLV